MKRGLLYQLTTLGGVLTLQGLLYQLQGIVYKKQGLVNQSLECIMMFYART